MKNAKIVAKPKYGPNLGPPKTNKSLGDYSGLYGNLCYVIKIEYIKTLFIIHKNI